MKAILIPSYTADPSSLVPTTVPTPRPHTDRPLLICITHCSPQHADILHAQGTHQNNNPRRGWCHPPFILGYDFAGVVDSLAASYTGDLQIGERVFGASIGAFAEYVAVGADAVRRVPGGLGGEAACAMAGQVVSYAAVVHVARVREGEVVLVSGASGGLGSACCMVAKGVGARVVALAGDKGKAEVMRRDMGVDLVVMVDEGGKWIEEVMEFTGGRGVDAVLDNTGMVNDAIRCLAYMGRIVVLGFAARKGIMESVKMNKLLLKSATVIGYRFGESGRRSPETLEEIWTGYLSMMEGGKLKTMIYGSYEGLEDVGRALGDLAARRVYGKVVVKVADGEDTAKL